MIHLKKVSVIVFVLSFMILSQVGLALAAPWGSDYQRGRHFHDMPRGYHTVVVNGASYYYANGVYFTGSGKDYVVVDAPTGGVITTLPSGYDRVVVRGKHYYRHHGNYYVKVHGGYQIVLP